MNFANSAADAAETDGSFLFLYSALDATAGFDRFLGSTTFVPRMIVSSSALWDWEGFLFELGLHF